MTTRLSTNGRIVLPQRIRDARNWHPGAEFIVEETPAGVLIRPKRPFPPKTLDEVAGCLPYKGKPKSIAQMNSSIRREAKRRHGRGRH